VTSKLEGFSEELSKLQTSATADALWTVFRSCAVRVGVDQMLIMKGDVLAFTRDQVWYTNVPFADIIRFETAQVGQSPLRRLALRSSEPILVSKIKPILAKSKADAWSRQFRLWVADNEVLLLPVRRHESLAVLGALSGPASAFDSLTCAMLNVALHAAVLRMEQLSSMPKRREQTRLTERERTCLGIAASGRNTREVAAQLRISERTARFHLDNVRTKLGVATRALAVRKALRLGILRKP
jgi:DNA-binding CsgD family transcriptional regulator